MEGFNFNLSPGASYVINKGSCTWYTSGAQSYISGQGARVIRLQINGDGWLDPSTLRVLFTINNNRTDGVFLKPFGGPWHIFRRVRCLYQGCICDDFDNYAGTHEMMHMLTSKAKRDNDDVNGVIMTIQKVLTTIRVWLTISLSLVVWLLEHLKQ